MSMEDIIVALFNAVLILIILEVLYEILASMLHRATVIVLILIILEVLYEILKDFFKVTKIYVLILIILEVLYEK